MSPAPRQHAISRLPHRLAALAMLLTVSLAGCGKTLTPKGVESSAGTVAAVGAHGAGGLSTKNTTRLGGAGGATDAAAVALAVYPGLTAATRPQAVVLVDGGNWPAALVAATLAGSPLHAPVLYSAGDTLPPQTAQALRAMAPTGAAALESNTSPPESPQVIQIGATATPASYTRRTVGANDAPQLAVEVERLSSLLRRHNPRSVIVTAADGPPAMTMPAAGLAAHAGAPILLVERSSVPRPTATELTQLGKTSIYVVGPSSVVSDSVVGQLRRYGPVTRIAGGTPAANAIAVARFTDGAFGWGIIEPGHGLVFANATRPLDGPAAAPLSATGDYAPLLLLESPDSLSVPLDSYLSDLQPGSPPSGPVHGVYNHGWLIGDESAISALTQASLDARLEISPHAATEPPLASTTTPSEPEPTQTTEP